MWRGGIRSKSVDGGKLYSDGVPSNGSDYVKQHPTAGSMNMGSCIRDGYTT